MRNPNATQLADELEAYLAKLADARRKFDALWAAETTPHAFDGPTLKRFCWFYFLHGKGIPTTPEPPTSRQPDLPAQQAKLTDSDRKDDVLP